jgi:hypothetical protein
VSERLRDEVEQNRAARSRIEEDRSQLRRLATELSLAEARERRASVVALHDDIIQKFAFVKLRIAQLRGDDEGIPKVPGRRRPGLTLFLAEAGTTRVYPVDGASTGRGRRQVHPR